jgi:hypothetical protein
MVEAVAQKGMPSMNNREMGRLLDRMGEVLEDINATMLELEPQVKAKFARQFARLYSLMTKIDTLRAENGKGQ